MIDETKTYEFAWNAIRLFANEEVFGGSQCQHAFNPFRCFMLSQYEN